MQFLVHLRLQGKPRNVTGTARNGTEYSFWTVDGEVMQMAAGSLAISIVSGRQEDTGTLVQGLDVDRLDYLGAIYFPPDGGETTKDHERLIKVLKQANSGDTLKCAIRLGFRYSQAASGSRVRSNNFTLVKAEMLTRGTASADTELPF